LVDPVDVAVDEEGARWECKVLLKPPGQRSDQMLVTQHQPRQDEGFTLIELLIVIVILGILASVVVFAVGGITDRGTASAQAADETTLVTAQEAYMAQHGVYADEATLASSGMLRGESDLHEIVLGAGGSDYTLSYVGPDAGGSGGGGPTTTVVATPWTDGDVIETTFGGFVVEQYGNGPEIVVFVGRTANTTQQDWGYFTSNESAIPGITMYNVIDPELDTAAELLTLANSADFILTGVQDYVESQQVGQVIFEDRGIWPANANHASTWWGWHYSMGSQQAISDFALFLQTQRNDGAPVGHSTSAGGYDGWASTDSQAAPLLYVLGGSGVRSEYETWLQSLEGFYYDDVIVYIEDSDLDTVAEVEALDLAVNGVILLSDTVLVDGENSLADLYSDAGNSFGSGVHYWRDTVDLGYAFDDVAGSNN
jgi:prepilin-type N-terminal cleavage/methylation domain-containing protein